MGNGVEGMNPEIERRRIQLDFPRTRLWELRGAGDHSDIGLSLR